MAAKTPTNAKTVVYKGKLNTNLLSSHFPNQTNSKIVAIISKAMDEYLAYWLSGFLSVFFGSRGFLMFDFFH